MKLVVTGHDSEGRSVFHHAGEPPRSPSPGSYDLWSTKGPSTVPDPTPADAPAPIGYFAEEEETSFKIVTVPPPPRSTGSPGRVRPAAGDRPSFRPR